MKKVEIITAEKLDQLFDDEDERYLDYFDLGAATRPSLEQQKVNVVLPKWMVQSLDGEAERLGITRQAIIKIWLDERLKVQTA